MRVEVDTNAAEVIKWLDALEKHDIPFATALGLTNIAKAVKDDIPDLLERAFDRPTPFTKRGVAIRAATKRRREARVFMKNKQAEYLRLQAKGGTRRPKRRALVVPSSTRRNKYGNIPRGQVKRLLARSDTFSGEVRGTAGIWQRMKSGRLKLLIAYATAAQYRKRFDFGREVHKLAERHAERSFARAFFSIKT